MHATNQPLWRQIQRENFSRWDKLADFLEFSPKLRKQILVQTAFPLNLPKRLAEKIVKGTLEDPILKQFLPLKAELKQEAGFSADPVADASFKKGPKLLQKYEGRALLVCTSACAMNCRYCFRQNYDYAPTPAFDAEMDAIAADPTLSEIILSGGDPLALSNETLKSLLLRLNAIPHVKRIRFHTRFPIGIPERIDEELLSLLKTLSKQVWVVIHVNHPRELDEDIFRALKQLQAIGITLLNQSVLLKGVNDRFAVLKELCETLVDQGILPYYLHQLDKVQGSAHFEVPETVGHALIRQLTESLPGYAVPKYVKEIAGEKSKSTLI
jgi:EF-P beta-lysylation protein EpmB